MILSDRRIKPLKNGESKNAGKMTKQMKSRMEGMKNNGVYRKEDGKRKSRSQCAMIRTDDGAGFRNICYGTENDHRESFMAEDGIGKN